MKPDESQLIAWRRELHQWPELSGVEFATTRRLREWLRSAGVRLLKIPMETGVVAEIGTGETVVALRADIDALPINETSGVRFHSRHPGIMHASGHDVHSAVMLGAALELKAQENTLPGRVRILFQPAEEMALGAKQFIAAGMLKDVQAIFGMHNEPGLPVGTFATRSGPFYANVDKFIIRVTGKHAYAAQPEQDTDAIVVTRQIIQRLQQLNSKFDSLLLSITRDGGKSWHVLPSGVEFSGTVRTHETQVRDGLEQQVRQLVGQFVEANGTIATLSWHAGPPVLINDLAWAQFSIDTAQLLGYRVQTAERHLGGEDFAFYLQQVPGTFVSIGSASDYGLYHGSYTPDESLIAPAAHYFTLLSQRALYYLRHGYCVHGAGKIPS